ncbi:MAG: UDP-N-acetylmuramoyl-L-alanine--D-glutamate ligase [Anaerolineae bacterium]|nr:UDP-N-acetylmuramoyl-L-alanine--D-glutamate ligase [Anaerolineae bacterium]
MAATTREWNNTMIIDPTYKPPAPEPLDGRRVVVLGAARQGRALGRWLPTVGAQVTLSDNRPTDQLADVVAEFEGSPVDLALGGHPLDLLDDCDLLCVSGGIPLTLPIVQAAFERGVRVTNDAQLFLERCPVPVMGITGSAGKTTTTALVGVMCRATGQQTFVGGNIGDVLLDVLPEIGSRGLVVMELSSFQLELMTVSPAVAAVLNVTPNHLDRHQAMDAYIAAKARIYRHQAYFHVAVFGRDDANAHRMSADAPGRMAYFSMRERVLSGAYLDGDDIVIVGDSAPGKGYRVVCPRRAIRLRGDHNVLNVLAACAVAGAAYVPVKAMRRAIESFEGVEHRLETVATLGGALWVNDSIATAPERVIAALHSYSQPVVLLAGGRDKKLPWTELAALAVQRCRAVIAFGEYGPEIVEHMRRAQQQAPGAPLDRVEAVPDLLAAVVLARDVAQPGDVVLLSPGGTSYDAYQDFAARGQHFRELVRQLQ